MQAFRAGNHDAARQCAERNPPAPPAAFFAAAGDAVGPDLHQPVDRRLPPLLHLPLLRHHLLQLHKLQWRRRRALDRIRQLREPVPRPVVQDVAVQHLLLHGDRAAPVDGRRARSGAAAQHEREGPGGLPDDLLHPLDRAARRLVHDLRLAVQSGNGDRQRSPYRRAPAVPGLVFLGRLVQAVVHPPRTVGTRPADGDLPGGTARGAEGDVRGRRARRSRPVAAVALHHSADDQPRHLLQRHPATRAVHLVLHPGAGDRGQRHWRPRHLDMVLRAVPLRAGLRVPQARLFVGDGVLLVRDQRRHHGGPVPLLRALGLLCRAKAAP